MSEEPLTRRTFINNSLIAGEAAALAVLVGGRIVTAAEIRSAEKHKEAAPRKLGILGCGNRSKAHLAALNDVAEIQVAALCDTVPHKMALRAQLIKTGPAPRQYTDMEKMFAQEDLDAVAVVLPNHLHKMATIAALQAGKHVFCEKPMALTVADCNEMIAISKRTGKAIQLGTQRRHAHSYKKAVETIRNSPLGKILASGVNSYRSDWRVPDADEYPAGVPYWRMIQAQCGGVVYEMGAHTIDVNNWIFDSEPVSVVSLQGVNDLALRSRDSMDHAGVLVRYANDALMNYGGNLYTHGPAGADYFFAANGTVALGDGKLEIIYGHSKGAAGKEAVPAPMKIDLPGGDGTNEQWVHFAKVLAGTADPYPDGGAGRQSIQICEGALVSSREGKMVKVKDLG